MRATLDLAALMATHPNSPVPAFSACPLAARKSDTVPLVASMRTLLVTLNARLAHQIPLAGSAGPWPSDRQGSLDMPRWSLTGPALCDRELRGG